MLGEQVFDALGQRWTLFLGNSAQCSIEAQYDKGFFAVVSDAMPDVDAATALAVAQSMADGVPLPPAVAEKAAAALRGMRLSVLRDLAWHGLRKAHPLVTIDRVSDIIDDLGHEAFGEIVGKAVHAVQAKREVGDDAATGKRVTQPKKPTGKR